MVLIVDTMTIAQHTLSTIHEKKEKKSMTFSGLYRISSAFFTFFFNSFPRKIVNKNKSLKKHGKSHYS